MPGPPAWRSPHAASPRPVRRRPARRCRAAAAPGPPPASPWRRRNRPASPAGAAARPRSGGGNTGTATPCCSAPQPGAHGGGARLQQRRQEQAEAAGLHADRLQRGARLRRQRVAFVAGDQAERLGQPVQQAAEFRLRPRPGRPAASSGARSWRTRSSTKRCSLIRSRSRCAPSRNSLSSTCTRGSQRAGAAPQPGDRHAVPDQRAVVAEREGGVRRGLHHGDAARHLLAQRPPSGAQHEALLVALGGRVGNEAEAVDAADGVALDDDLAAAGHRREQLLGLARLQPAHQMRGAAVDEAAGQPLVQRVRQQVLDLARAALPVRRCPAPSRPRAAM